MRTTNTMIRSERDAKSIPDRWKIQPERAILKDSASQPRQLQRIMCHRTMTADDHSGERRGVVILYSAEWNASGNRAGGLTVSIFRLGRYHAKSEAYTLGAVKERHCGSVTTTPSAASNLFRQYQNLQYFIC